jgi:hypothetical protein
MCRKYGLEEELSYHIFCQQPVLARPREKIYSYAWLEPTDIMRTTIRIVLVLPSQSWGLCRSRRAMHPSVVSQYQ